MSTKAKWRSKATEALESYFRRRSYPRTMLTLLLLLTGIAGFLVSYALLQLGVDHMWVRYPIAVLAGYAVLLGLVRIWVEVEKRRFDPEDPAIKAAISAEEAGHKSHSRPPSRWWDYIDVLDVGGFDDEGCLPVFAIGALIILAATIVVAVAGAPALVAEVFLDAFLVSVLYRRLRIAEKEHWLGTAIRETWLPALIAAIALAFVGWTLEKMVPGARSIGKALEQLWH